MLLIHVRVCTRVLYIVGVGWLWVKVIHCCAWIGLVALVLASGCDVFWICTYSSTLCTYTCTGTRVTRVYRTRVGMWCSDGMDVRDEWDYSFSTMGLALAIPDIYNIWNWHCNTNQGLFVLVFGCWLGLGLVLALWFMIDLGRSSPGLAWPCLAPTLARSLDTMSWDGTVVVAF